MSYARTEIWTCDICGATAKEEFNRLRRDTFRADGIITPPAGWEFLRDKVICEKHDIHIAHGGVLIKVKTAWKEGKTISPAPQQD